MKLEYVAKGKKCCPWCDGKMSKEWNRCTVVGPNTSFCVDCGLKISDYSNNRASTTLIFIE